MKHPMKRTSTPLLHPTAETFPAQVLESDLPVVVDFWAPWCPPCLLLKPELQSLAHELAGRVRFAFINVDEEPELAGLMGVTSIPAVMVFQRGARTDAWTGYAPRAAIRDRLELRLGLAS